MAEETHFSGIAGRYARALLELAEETKSVDTVAADLAALKGMVLTSPDLARFVQAPVFSREDQKKGMAALLKEAGASKLTTQFVLLLAAKRRLFVLMDAIRAFESQIAKEQGVIDAEVTAARPLANSEVAALKETLKATLGREPRLDMAVDPAILGGLVVKVGSRMIDSSLRTKLNAMRLAMRGA